MTKNSSFIWNMITIALILVLGVAYFINPINNGNALFFIACILFIYAIKYCLSDFSSRVVFFCYLVCFFTFLITGQFASKYMGQYGSFSEEIEKNTDICLMISLIGLLVGYIFAERKKWKFSIGHKTESLSLYNYDGVNAAPIRTISKWVFYLTYILWMFLLIKRILFVMTYGYLSYYIGYSSGMPVIFVDVANMAPVCFSVFLATMPSREEARLPIVLYVLYSVVSILSGRRLHIVTGLMLIFSYYVIRNKRLKDGEKPWLSKKTLILICIFVPVFISFLYIFGNTRVANSVAPSSGDSPIMGFFVSQGVSINVIKYAQKFQNELMSGAFYSLYNTVKFISKSMLGGFFGLDAGYSYGAQSIATATNSNYLADFISYRVNSMTYEEGVGLGSCYIAELFVDFGFIGVFLGNVVYGFLLFKLFHGALAQKNIWKISLGLIITEVMFKAPRATFDAFVTSIIEFSTVGAFLIIWFILYCLQKKRGIWT